MADANPAEVQTIVNQIIEELDKRMKKHVADALGAAPTPGPSPTPAAGDIIKYLAEQIFILCRVTGMPVDKRLSEISGKS